MTPIEENRFVCVNNAEFSAPLELHKTYRVMPNEEAEVAEELQLVDESGEDYLYHAERFIHASTPETNAR